MNRTLLTALVVALPAIGCAQQPQPSATPAPTTGPQTSQTRPDGERGPGGRRGDRMAALFQGITLTADQQTRVDQIREKYRSQMQALDPRNNEADRQKMMEAMRAQADEIRNVLTAEQQAVFDRNLEEMRSRGPRRGERPNG